MAQGRLTVNVTWNLLALAIQTIIAFATVPLLLGSVGQVAFGLYAFFASVVLLSGVIQAGLNLATAKNVAEDLAAPMEQHTYGELAFSYVVAAGSGVLQAVVILCVIVIPGVLSADDRSASLSIAVIFAVSAVVNGPFLVAKGVLVGLERFLLRNLLELLVPIAGIVSVVGMKVLGGHDIWVYVLAIETTRLVGNVVALWRVQIAYPHLRVMRLPRRLPRATSAFQLKQIGNQVADLLFTTSDKFVLQILLGPTAVARYQIADRVNTLAQGLTSSPLVAIVPRLAAAMATKDERYITRMLTLGSRRYCLVALPPLIAIMAFASPLISWWVGPGYQDSALAAQIFLASVLVPIPFKVYSHFRVAEGTIGWITLLKLVYAPINLAASILLATPLGIVGVALPTAFFYCFVYPVGLLVSIIRRHELGRFFTGVWPSILVGVAMSAGNLLAAHALGAASFSMWETVVACASSVLVSFAALSVSAGFHPIDSVRKVIKRSSFRSSQQAQDRDVM